VFVKHGILFLAGRTGRPPRKRNKKNNHQTVSMSMQWANMLLLEFSYFVKVAEMGRLGERN
jgi:hypothetical protein